MTELHQKRCQPCEGGQDPMDRERAENLLSQLEGWDLSEDGKSIHRRYEFKGFYRTMAFINAMAWIANQQQHHPDFCAGYNFCEVTFTTHAIDGLSENDFIMASRLDRLLDPDA